MIESTFRIVHYMPIDRYVGMAWNHDKGIMMATRDYPSYSDARDALQVCADLRRVWLRWFDGEYICKDGNDFINKGSV